MRHYSHHCPLAKADGNRRNWTEVRHTLFFLPSRAGTRARARTRSRNRNRALAQFLRLPSVLTDGLHEMRHYSHPCPLAKADGNRRNWTEVPAHTLLPSLQSRGRDKRQEQQTTRKQTTIEMSYVRIWIHTVFATRQREAFLSDDVRADILCHIRTNCAAKGIFIQTIGGYVEHIHCLLSLGKMQTIADTVRLMKGESAFWINKNRICPYYFAWQDDYFAVSVSESHVKKVTEYIENQEQHHAGKTYAQETEEFISRYGFQLIKDKGGKRYVG